MDLKDRWPLIEGTFAERVDGVQVAVMLDKVMLTEDLWRRAARGSLDPSKPPVFAVQLRPGEDRFRQVVAATTVMHAIEIIDQRWPLAAWWEGLVAEAAQRSGSCGAQSP